MANLVNAICNDIRVKVKSNLPNHNTITYGQLTSRQILGDVWDGVKQPIFNCVKLTEVRNEMVGLNVTIAMSHILKRKS